jgi:AcrR family transcriptional regulator
MAKGQRQAEPAKRSTRRQAAAPAARREPKASTGAGGAKTAGRPDTAARRAAILDAALTVFAAHGYESARLDDVAAKAGVAKGTLYLYFEDKEALFEAMVRSAVAPVMDNMGAAAAMPGLKPADFLRLFFTTFEREVLGTRRKLLLRLIMTEGPRFPRIAEFYYREVVSRGIGMMQAVAQRAVESGEFTSDAAARFPQLIVAPLMLAVIWDGLFGKMHPLDMPNLLEAHLELLSGRRTGQ